MCELLGMECNTPTDITFSFSGLRQRGGRTGPHRDGWGLAFYEGRAARAFIDPEPAADSPLASFLAQHPIKTELAIGHIRRRTRGPISLANTHPFLRELWGRHWVFAHNGTIPGAKKLPLGRFRPIGTTDSEHAFCYLLESLRASFDDYPTKVSLLWQAVADIGGELGQRGVFNFLLGDGRFLYARCATRLWHIVRRAPFGVATLKDHELQVDFSTLTTPDDRVAVVATQPLTINETWVEGVPEHLWVFGGGVLRTTLPSRRAPRKLVRRAAARRARG